VRFNNVGDQFGESNKHLLTRVFNWFYFSINAGSALSTLIIPWLLEPYQADPNGFIAKLSPSVVSFLENPRLHSPDIAFVCLVCSCDCDIFFWAGRKKFVHIPPVGLGPTRARFSIEKPANSAQCSDTSSFHRDLLGLVAAKFLVLDRSAESMDRHLFGIEWSLRKFRRQSDFYFGHAAALFLLALSVSGKVRQADAARKIGAGCSLPPRHSSSSR